MSRGPLPPRLSALSVLVAATLGLSSCLPGGTPAHPPPGAVAAPRERESPEPPHRVHSRADDVAVHRPPGRLSIPSIGDEAAVEEDDFLGVHTDPRPPAWFRNGAA